MVLAWRWDDVVWMIAGLFGLVNTYTNVHGSKMDESA